MNVLNLLQNSGQIGIIILQVLKNLALTRIRACFGKPHRDDHIRPQHNDCIQCDKGFPTHISLNNHMGENHKKVRSKHTIEKEPSMQNLENPKI